MDSSWPTWAARNISSLSCLSCTSHVGLCMSGMLEAGAAAAQGDSPRSASKETPGLGWGWAGWWG